MSDLIRDSALDRMSAHMKRPDAPGKHVHDFAGAYTACDVRNLPSIVPFPRHCCSILRAYISADLSSILKASVKALLALYPALLQDLGPRRVGEMDEASEMGELFFPPSFPVSLLGSLCSWKYTVERL